MSWHDRVGSVLHPLLMLPVRAALRGYFGKVTIRDAERLPSSGPVLVVANHPATLSEVFLLGTRLHRRFHFLAASFVFRPWIRGVVVRIAGAVPIYRRQDDPTQTYRNEDAFRACHDLFDRGGAIVIFPEGESRTDRALLPLKTGAARLALEYESRRAGSLAVVPVGIHFSDRTRFRSDAVVSVGRPIDLRPFAGSGDPQEAVRSLTATMQRSLESLILNVPDDAMVRFLGDVERLYLQDLKEKRPDEIDLDLLRRVADCMRHYQSADPQRVYTAWRRTTAYWRKLHAVGLADPAFQDEARFRTATRRAVLVGLGAIAGFAPAALGFLINALPFYASDVLAKAVAPQAILISGVRMIAGVLLFPLTYGLLALGLRRLAGWSWPPIGAALIAAVGLGFFALAYLGWLKTERERLRFAWVASRDRRLVAELRAERKALIRLFEEARSEYLASIAGAGGLEAPSSATRNPPALERSSP